MVDHMIIPDEWIEESKKELRDIEDHLRLPHGFIIGLLSVPDWEFVIKLNAVFEDLATVALARQLSIIVDGGLIETFSRLGYADVRCGKLAFLEKMGCIGVLDCGFLRSFCGLRNRLAHGIRNLTFSFDDYIVRLDKEQSKNFVTKFTSSGAFLCQTEVFGEPRESGKALAFPKEFIFCGAVDVAHSLNSVIVPEGFQGQIRELVGGIFQSIDDAATKSAIEGLSSESTEESP